MTNLIYGKGSSLIPILRLENLTFRLNVKWKW